MIWRRGGNAWFVLLVLANTSCRSDHAVDCHVLPNGQPARCIQNSDGRILVVRGSLARVEFGPEGLATIVVGERDLYFVTPNGTTAPAFRFDNGADYLVEGLARTVKDGKVGFVNSHLEIVAPPVWDFAAPFERGVARVCVGCRSVPLGDEHSSVSGGKWGYIDKHGKVVVPVEFDERSLPSVEEAARLAAH